MVYFQDAQTLASHPSPQQPHEDVADVAEARDETKKGEKTCSGEFFPTNGTVGVDSFCTEIMILTNLFCVQNHK